MQKWLVIFIVVLTLVLGFKIITIERNNTAFNTFFTETRDRIKLLSTEVGSIEKKITKEKAEDDETKIELFSKLSQRLKALEKVVKESDKDTEGAKKPKEEMTVTERIS